MPAVPQHIAIRPYRPTMLLLLRASLEIDAGNLHPPWPHRHRHAGPQRIEEEMGMIFRNREEDAR